MKVGYLRCAACGAETNCVELTAGLCPACKDERVRELSLLHRRYDRAILAGDLSAASMRWRAMSVSGGSGCLLRPLWLKCAAP